MKLQSRLSLNQVGHSPSRPQTGAIAQHLRAFFEPAAQLLQLPRQQPGFATGSTSFEQRLGALLAPGLVPTTDRLAVDSQLSSHFALAQSTVKESGGFESSPFQASKIACYAFWIAHVRTLTRVLRSVTILCESQ
jgi:hypothetical protein